MIFITSLLLLSLNGFDFTTNFTAVAATLNNIGPKRTILGTIVGVCFASFFYYFLNAKEINSFKK